MGTITIISSMAPRTEEAEIWYGLVYSAIREIPAGRVTSYGHIARLVGYRESDPTSLDLSGQTVPPLDLLMSSCSSKIEVCIPTPRNDWFCVAVLRLTVPCRQVGVCLKHLPDEAGLPFNSSNVPWQRVINSKGCISSRYESCPEARHCNAVYLSAFSPDH